MLQSGDDASQKKQDYRKLVESLRQAECQLDKLFDQQTKLQEVLQEKELMDESLKETIFIYEEQVNLHRQFHGDVAAIDIQRSVLLLIFEQVNVAWQLY